MTQQHIISDVGTVTKIPNKILDWLTDMTNLCIGSAISDAKLQGLDKLVLNIGIGTLAIDMITMESKFLPSKNLKSIIKNVVTTQEPMDPIIDYVDEELVKKLINICEEVI
jgi:CII-binding regulator of phage lambda lysogenization HflD